MRAIDLWWNNENQMISWKTKRSDEKVEKKVCVLDEIGV